MATPQPARTYNQDHIARKYTPGKRRVSIYWTWSYPWETNRDVTELDNRFSTMTEVRRVAWPDFEATEWDKMNFLQGIAGTLELFHRSSLSFQQDRRRGDRASRRRVPAHRSGRLQAADRRTCAGRHGHAVGVWPGPPRRRTGSRAGRNRGDSRMAQARRNMPAARPAPRCRLHGRLEAAADGISPPRRRTRATPAAIQPVHTLADEGARRPGHQSMGASSCSREGDEGDCAADRVPRPRQGGTAEQRHHIQFSPALAALRSDQPRTPSRCMSWAGNSSIPIARIPSQPRATRSSTACSGCRRTNNEPATSCSSTPPTSPRSSAARTAWQTFGEISR